MMDCDGCIFCCFSLVCKVVMIDMMSVVTYLAISQLLGLVYEEITTCCSEWLPLLESTFKVIL